jgi:hypothetical protein
MRKTGFGLRASGFGLAMVLAIAACKHDAPATTTTPTGGSDVIATPPAKKQTPYEARRETACKALGKKMTACAVEGAKADVAAGKGTQKDLDEQTKPEVLERNTEKATHECERITTTYQLRVVEVCQEKETQCDPLFACLEHINDTPPAKP